jgi:D-hydroxyproline dehydrogenase subunit gamma
MNARRLTQFTRGEPFEILVDEQPVPAYAGETVATVLLAAGHVRFYHDPVSGADGRLFCGIGVCQQCLTLIDGELCQACRTMARPGMKVETNPCK